MANSDATEARDLVKKKFLDGPLEGLTIDEEVEGGLFTVGFKGGGGMFGSRYEIVSVQPKAAPVG